MMQVDKTELLEVQMDLDGISNLLVALETSEVCTKEDVSIYRELRNSLGQTTTYTYGKLGRVTETVDANGDTNIFAYDICDNLMSETDALAQTQHYTYYGNGNTTLESDKLGSFFLKYRTVPFKVISLKYQNKNRRPL